MRPRTPRSCARGAEPRSKNSPDSFRRGVNSLSQTTEGLATNYLAERHQRDAAQVVLVQRGNLHTLVSCFFFRSPCTNSDTIIFRLKNILFFYFLLRWTRRSFWKIKGRGLIGSIVELYTNARRIAYGLFLNAPGVRSKVKAQVDEAKAKLQAKLIKPGETRYLALPKKGWSDDDLRVELERLAQMDHTRWEDGFVSGAVYHGEDSLIKLQTEAYGKFTVANPIHPDVFPGVRKMEAEVVAMVLSLFNGPPSAAGVTTSGGTESILMACLSARQKAYVERGVTEPEM